MPASRDEVFRVGLRLVIVALVAGLLALFLSPRAHSTELAVPTEQEALLLAPTEPLGSAERIERAEAVLASDKRRRFSNVGAHVLDLGVRAAMQASPRRLLYATRDVVRDLWSWRKRSPAEDRALDLLEAERAALGPEELRLYDRLRARERGERADRLFAQAEAALERGRLWRAQHTLDRASALGLSSKRVGALTERLDAARVPEIDTLSLAPDFAPWEAQLAAALLTDRYERVLDIDAPRDDAKLARATALYLAGERGDALGQLGELGELQSVAGVTARDWLGSAGLNPENDLTRELTRYKRRRALGWVGGSALAEHGFSLSSNGYSAWKDSLSPLNLVVSTPSRIFHGFEPDAGPLRAAADRYLQLLPDGTRSDEARGWLERLPVDTPRRAKIWDDGVLVLPRPRTDYRRTGPRPLLVALGAFDPEILQALGSGFEGADAVLLTVADPDADGGALPGNDALELISTLADGLEQRRLTSHEDHAPGAVLDTLRRLDVGVRAGRPLTAEPWLFLDPAGLGVALRGALKPDHAEKTRERLADELPGVMLAQGRKDVKISRTFLGRDAPCPQGLLCVDRANRASGDVYARLGVDGDVRVGAHTGVGDATLGFELSPTGAEASIGLPVARWLGVAEWIPLRASIAIGLDGLSIGTEHEAEEDPAAPQD